VFLLAGAIHAVRSSPSEVRSELWSDLGFRLLGRTLGSDFWVGLWGRTLGGYTVTKNSTTRSYSAKRIAQKVSAMPEIRKISASTVYRILIDNNYKSCKQTVKPGLSIDMQEKRLAWCLLYKDWTLED
jgi:hypothetical protein